MYMTKLMKIVRAKWRGKWHKRWYSMWNIGFTESKCINEMQDKIIEVLPAEGHNPIRIFKDKYVKEMNFPTLFFGDPHDKDITNKYSNQKVAKWELQHSNKKFTYHTTNLFLKTIKILIEQVMSTIWTRLCKGQLKGRKLLAKDVKKT